MPAPTDPKKAQYMFCEDIKFLQKVVIFHPDENKFLALKRSANDYSRANRWDLSGGNVRFGEKYDEALMREVGEETGLKITDIRPLQVVTNYVDSVYYLFIGYRARTTQADVVITEEHSEYRWVTKSEFLELESADFLRDLVGAL